MVSLTTNRILRSEIGGPSTDPLAGLCAMNPLLKGHIDTDPGLKAFLDKNAGALISFSPSSPPPRSVRTDVDFESWCHGTQIVAPALRDEEYIVVVARGSAYQAGKQIEIPLTNGGKGTSDGVIAFVGKTKDYLATFVPDNDHHYPGSGGVKCQFPVFGAPGEKVELTYCRIKPDAQGRAHANHSAWPDSFHGVFGGYAGRDREVLTVSGGTVQLLNPA